MVILCMRSTFGGSEGVLESRLVLLSCEGGGDACGGLEGRDCLAVRSVYVGTLCVVNEINYLFLKITKSSNFSEPHLSHLKNPNLRSSHPAHFKSPLASQLKLYIQSFFKS